ncbi:DUF5686 and carboxypeptidase regulatory-like domain-containing protein [Gillisia sp. M10.2A]|uniref:DUF5686 and carboxypeptidase regulatory-like domain-containing protein n=1 Tax=Gillisia lutea TaxID=2909668 RepID=A0ABS9EFQ6_9FLAO|nr:DUF5686 family protein [Gillisia lutea]MCF4100291.1 DUF5686 and carboxypeptidase regulatory-like domain-containing protein [Gillisia lutea]
MRKFLLLSFLIISFQSISAQQIIRGTVVNSKTGDPLPYANIQVSEEIGTLTNINGTFEIQVDKKVSELLVTYVGYALQIVPLTASTEIYIIQLQPQLEDLAEVMLYSGENPANKIIQLAIKNKINNEPEKALDDFSYKSYNKFIIDNQANTLKATADSSMVEVKTLINKGRAYLSEKVSSHYFKRPAIKREVVEAIKTAGFKKPVYDVLSLKVEPLSLYKKDYTIFDTKYAAPLANNALSNYTYKILDTVNTSQRPAYVIYYKPKREQVVAGLEGILYLDTITYAIQKAKAQLIGVVNLEVEHNYTYYKKENIWFPNNQTTTLKPGTGEKDISVFGGSISVGAVQRKRSLLNNVLATGEVENDLYLSSTTTNYDIEFNSNTSFQKSPAWISVAKDADTKSLNYWEVNRQTPYTFKDEFTEYRVDSIIKARDIEHKIEVKKAIANGHYPVHFWDFDLSKFVKYNNYEGLRLGVGGNTNDKLSEKFQLNGYLVYGFIDHTFKYGLGAATLLNKPTGTWLNVNYYDDIREVGSFKYLRGINDFSILEPRFVNISYYYNYQSLQTSLKHRVTPRLETEWVLAKSDITQIGNYAFLNNNQLYKDYTITEATLGFLWRPFSKFLSTPESHIIIDKQYPQFTGQFSHSFANFLGGDFNFTKFGLKAEYQINRLDQSNTQFTLEGNYGFGDIPLTHAFHAYPNSPNKEAIISRFSIAGKLSFETMYFNEFFSERQVALHVRHQLRPINISEKFRPEIVLISRFALGDFENFEAHQNIEFKSLKHGYSEAGLEINKLFGGFGLSGAYRYGAYHLPTLRENISFKFTFQLKI